MQQRNNFNIPRGESDAANYVSALSERDRYEQELREKERRKRLKAKKKKAEKRRLLEEKRKREERKRLMILAGSGALALILLISIIAGIVSGVKKSIANKEAVKKAEQEASEQASIEEAAKLTEEITTEATTEAINLVDEFTEEELSGKDVLVMQTDPRWKDKSYGSSTIAVSGCGPTCLSMVLLHFFPDKDRTPSYMCDWSDENGYYISGAGTSWTLMTDGCEEFGLQAEILPLVQKYMEDRLDDGAYLVISVKPGIFTEVGHYLVIYGYNSEGFLINDPNSAENSSKAWSYETIEGEITNIWSFTPKAEETE